MKFLSINIIHVQAKITSEILWYSQSKSSEICTYWQNNETERKSRLEWSTEA